MHPNRIAQYVRGTMSSHFSDIITLLRSLDSSDTFVPVFVIKRPTETPCLPATAYNSLLSKLNELQQVVVIMSGKLDNYQVSFQLLISCMVQKVPIDWARLCQSSLNSKTPSLSPLILKKELNLNMNFFEFTNLKKYLIAASNAGHTIIFKMLAPAMSRNVLRHIFSLRIVLIALFPNVLTMVKIMLLIVFPGQYLKN